jgi:hypothetical protein
VAKNESRQSPESNAIAEIKSVVNRARQGDASVLPRLRVLLDEHRSLWQRHGDLGAQAEMAWATLVAGTDLHLRECLLRKAEALREELAGRHPSTVERLLVDRVVACWMQMAYHDALAAQSLGSEDKPRLMAFRVQRQEQSQRQYLGALAALTTLRKLLPKPTAAATPASHASASHRPERDGNRRNGHASELPPGVHNRLSAYFDEPPLGAGKRQRKQEMAGVGVDG